MNVREAMKMLKAFFRVKGLYEGQPPNQGQLRPKLSSIIRVGYPNRPTTLIPDIVILDPEVQVLFLIQILLGTIPKLSINK